MKEPSLLVEGLSVIYSNGHKALDKASFSIPRQSITALVGINGSGKSTLFKAIMGFVKSSGGRIELFGGSVKDALKANLVAYVPCLLYTSPSPRDRQKSRMPSSA